MDFINTYGALMDQLLKLFLPHWPGLCVFFILTIVGQHMSLKVFTRPRAYKNYGKGAGAKWKWRFFYWGRETLALQPILAGILIGLVWVDPEGHNWTRATSVGYFATAGTASLFGWALLKGLLKKRGIELQLPGGESVPPDRLPYDEDGELPVVIDSSKLAPPKLPSIDPSPLPLGSLPPPPEDADVEEKTATLPPIPKSLKGPGL